MRDDFLGTACCRSADCPDLNCPGRPAADCTTCKGTCPVPQACGEPEPTPAPRKGTFLPTFDITGPHLPRTRKGWGRVLQTGLGIAGLFFILGAVLRHTGVL